MRIGIDVRLWNETGVGRYTRNLVRELALLDKRSEYTLFALTKDSDAIKFEIRNSKFEIRIADIRWHTVKEQIEFPKILNRENLDLVHLPYFSVPILYKRPYVVTIHDLIVHHFPTGQASTLPYPLYRIKLSAYYFAIAQAAKNCQKIISVSEATKKEIVDHLNVAKEKIVVTHEGVDESLFSIKKNEPLFSDYFLYIGNAYPHKNLKRLVEAFHLIKRKHPNTKLILAGKEDYFYQKLKVLIPQDGNIIYFGHATDQELVSLMQHAHALMQPSLMEGFGLPPLEAMASHCLVACSDIPSLREIGKDYALYFDPFSVQSIAATMQSILTTGKSHYAKHVADAYIHAKTFSWRKMAKETLHVYEESF